MTDMWIERTKMSWIPESDKTGLLVPFVVAFFVRALALALLSISPSLSLSDSDEIKGLGRRFSNASFLDGDLTFELPLGAKKLRIS